LLDLRHADHASRRRTSGATARDFNSPSTLSKRAPTSFAHEESPASHLSAWCSAPALVAPPYPHRTVVDFVAAGARRRRRATSAASSCTRGKPRCGRRLGVRPNVGPRLIGLWGVHCFPIASERLSGRLPTLRRRRPSGWPQYAALKRSHEQCRRSAPSGGGEGHDP